MHLGRRPQPDGGRAGEGHSLWLDAFTIGATLSFLDHHLRCGNSLIGATFKDLEHAVTTDEHYKKIGRAKLLFGIDYDPLLRAVRHVIQVNAMADATAAEVRQSASEYGEARDQLAGYQVVLDLLVARHFGVPDAPELLSRGGSELDLSSRSRFMQSLEDLNELVVVEKVERIAKEPQLRFFHWEIEFPEIFFDFVDANQRQIRHKNEIREGSAGFDAVVGNPPFIDKKKMARQLPQQDKYWKQRHETASGIYDAYMLWGRSLHAKLRRAHDAFMQERNDEALLASVAVLAEEFGKGRPGAVSPSVTRRDDLELICFEYVTG